MESQGSSVLIALMSRNSEDFKTCIVAICMSSLANSTYVSFCPFLFFILFY